MKKFDVPVHYRSSIIDRIKVIRKNADPKKKNIGPSILDFDGFSVLIPRHFGFCYGVENAIEIAYQTLDRHRDQRVFMVSEMIHNPSVNDHLRSLGLQFLSDTKGNELIPISELKQEDIVMIPAFGTTIEMENKLNDIGLELAKYDTTCPFVERVWKAGNKLAAKDFSLVIHGKATHEETRATFSHTTESAPAVIVQNMEEVDLLITHFFCGQSKDKFYSDFAGKYSVGFDPHKHLDKLGVINQTTMLASDTQAIADKIKACFVAQYGDEYRTHFADTRDTLCYATLENQQAIESVLQHKIDFGLIVGGYNSSNTSHLVELVSERVPCYFISNAICLEDMGGEIHYFDLGNYQEQVAPWPEMVKQNPRIVLAGGASCPDILLEEVIHRLMEIIPHNRNIGEVMALLESNFPPYEEN